MFPLNPRNRKINGIIVEIIIEVLLGVIMAFTSTNHFVGTPSNVQTQFAGILGVKSCYAKFVLEFASTIKYIWKSTYHWIHTCSTLDGSKAPIVASRAPGLPPSLYVVGPRNFFVSLALGGPGASLTHSKFFRQYPFPMQNRPHDLILPSQQHNSFFGGSIRSLQHLSAHRFKFQVMSIQPPPDNNYYLDTSFSLHMSLVTRICP